MGEWKKCKISDCVELTMGQSPSGSDINSDGVGVPFLQGNRTFGSLYPAFDTWTTSPTRMAKAGDVIMSVRAPVGDVNITPVDFCLGRGVCSMRMFAGDQRFLYYLIRYNHDAFVLNQNGTIFGSVNREDIKNLLVAIPDSSTQRKIAEVLGAIDDKIETNRKICANLEAQAQALFKSWFVDFEPFGGKMPKGWKEVPLSSIATYLNGLAMQKYRPSDDEDSLPVLKIKELRQGFCDAASERCSASIDPRYVIHDGDVIFSWSGSLLVDFWCGGTAGLNQHLFKVFSDRYDKWFVYSWTNHYLASFIKIAADKATTMGHITRDHLDDAKVCIPFDSDIEQVGRAMKPLYDEIVSRRIESRALATMRDALLPKLMSGEIDVSKVEVA